MSGRPNKEEDKKSSGPGLTTGLLLAGGAAALGWLANTLWHEFKNEQESCGSEQGQRTQRSSTSSWDNSPRSRMETRKQNHEDKSSDDVPAGQKCIICFDNPREILLEPCNHVCLCENCAERISSSCPVCRVAITRKRPVYL